MKKGKEHVKVLFVAYSRSSLGHVVRCATAAELLVAAGHDTVVACHESVRGVVESRGIGWRPVREIEPAPSWTGIRDREVLRGFVRGRLAGPEYVSMCLEDELALIDDYRPDVVVADMRNTATVAASLRGVPACSLHNLRLFQNPMHVILPELLVTLAEVGVGEEHARAVLGDTMLVPDLPLLDPLTEVPAETMALVASLLPEIRHVGPIVAADTLRVAATPRTELPQRRGRDRLVSVLLGGGAWFDTVLDDLLAALPTDVQAEIVLAREPEGEVTRAYPERVRVTGFRRDAVDLMRASDAAVVHGGHGTLGDGLIVGTPMVCVPETTEQERNGRRVAELGVAEVLPADALSDRLGVAVEAALSAERQEASERFAERLRGAALAGDLVAAVERSTILA